MQLPPLSLYVHIPWCVRKCPYCDFNSHEQKAELPESQYVEALLKDLAADAAMAQGRPLESIFIGGGTPSLFSGAAIGRILDGARELIGFADKCEITMEANPGTIEHDSFKAYREAGVTRLSLGVQSFGTEQLKALGRIHDRTQAEMAAAQALSAGFDSVNLDLMHGLPGQTPELALADIMQAADLAPPHLSWYQLTIEPNTQFYSKPPTLPQDEALWQIFDEGQARMQSLGYRQYEVSAWAQPGMECQHNLNYWKFGDYLGIGCGAHGKLTDPSGNRILRTEKIKHPKGYLQAIDYRRDVKPIAEQELPLEYLMNRARLLEAIPKAEYQAYTGLSWRSLSQKLAPAAQRGLLSENQAHWQLTDKGQLFVNEILGLLVED
ncbi:radical SAM family heme chaperone HemW [Paraferrimonas sedimenticola]|uniref:Heme chaperone HemW n=1 Tax=Paraferrimonas sedimenticola TaxID=375674 RepID=A0AA37RZJ3_9GAMM|nr:radical SAM family heme chaperone HemW [Paraferrimonas sedimenticola]GLP98101.1 YggW family oxidoreductase [Paraferrimonas sedimenticola]